MADDAASPAETRTDLLAGLDLHALLAEVTERIHGVAQVADRIQALLSAVVSIGSQLELPEVLQRVTETAAELVDARYAALGVLDPSGESRLSQFITVGLDDDVREEIGDLPHGRGVLGVLITEPRAIRLQNIADHPASYGFPPNHPPMKTFLGVPISVRGEAFGNLYLTEKRGGEFTDADEQVVTALASAAGLAVANARLYERAQRRQQWLEATSSIQTRLLGGASAEDVLPDLVSTARQLAGADLAMLALQQPDGAVRVQAADGVGAEEIYQGLLPEESLTASVMRTGELTVVADAQSDPRIWQGLMTSVDVGPALYVPLGRSDAPLGTLVVCRIQGSGRFDEERIRLVESFAGQASIALQLGAASEDRQQLAVLGDRDRIARDLHDLVIQRLFAVGMSLEGTVRGMPPDKAARVRQAVDDLDATIKEIRTTIFALQTPAPLAGEGIRTAILGAAEVAQASLGFQPSLTFHGPVDTLVPGDIGEQLLAVLREALSNAARHAEATAVDVSVHADPQQVELEVADNGKGLPEGGRRSGLANLERRATDLGGSFEISRNAPSGTRLRWAVPLN